MTSPAGPPAGGVTTRDEKRVGWAELFFDLVYVFAVTQVSALLFHDHGWLGLARALIVFVPMWWAWVGATFYTNIQNADLPGVRLVVLTAGLIAMGMAIAVPQAYHARALLFAISYLALRALLFAATFRAGAWRRLNPYTIALGVSAPLLVLGAALGGWAQFGLWAAAALLDLATPRLTRRNLANLRVETSHLPERFGLFIIIALGESVVAVGATAADHRITIARGAAVAVGYLLAGALWWVTFVFAAYPIQQGLEQAERRGRSQLDILRHVFSYGHLVFVFAVIVVAVATEFVVLHPDRRLPVGVAALLYLGVAAFLIDFGYARWWMFGTFSRTRVPPGLLCIALLPLGIVLPALAALALVTAVLLAVNIFEHVTRGRYAPVRPGSAAAGGDR